jgi:integrase
MNNTELLKKMDQIISLLKNGQFAVQQPTKKQQKRKNKRGNDDMQRGSITYRSDGRWMGRCYDENKKQKSVYGRTKKECAEKLKALIDEIERRKRNPQANTSMELFEYFELWFKTYREPTLKESSIIQTKRLMLRHLENIGSCRIINITAEMLQLAINSVKSPKERSIVFSNLNMMYEKLFFMGAIPQNIMGMVVIANNEKNAIKNLDTEEKQILELGEENTFKYKRNEIKYKHFIEFAINTGMRPAEILGLQKKDIDFVNKCIIVNKQMNTTTRKLSSPKSKKGNRIIPLFDKTESLLLSMHLSPLKEEDFIFELNYTAIQTFLKKLSIRMNSSSTITCKMFRKTFSSRCQHVYGIDPKQVQNWLGHEKYDTTDKHYTYISESETMDNIKRYNNAVSDTQLDTHI